MRYYYREKDWIWIGFEYRPYLVAEMKKFKCHYNPATREWYTQLGLENSMKFKGFFEENGFVNQRVIQPRDVELKSIHNIVDEELLKEMIEYLNFSMTPRSYQIEGITYMINHGNCINGCEMGLGKAQPLDMKIYTKNGLKNFGELTLNDEVFGSDGKLQKIEAIYPQGIKDCYKITFSDNSFIECCDEHLWTLYYGVYRDQKNRKLITVPLKKVIERGIKTKTNIYYWRLPLINRVEFPTQEVLIHPYLLGYLLGDGCLGYRIQVSIGKQDQHETLERLSFYYKGNLSKIYSKNVDSMDFIFLKQKELRNSLREYRLLGTHSWNKEIPEKYLRNSSEIRIELLQGIVDSDGYVTPNGTIEIALASKKMIEQIRFIVKSLGGLAGKIRTYETSYEKNEVRIQCRTSYRISIQLPKDIIPCKLKRKRDLILKKKSNLIKSITDIQYVGKKEMQCIKVSNKDALYACGEDFILTHNTSQSLLCVETLDLFPCLIICPSTVKSSWLKEWNRWNPKRSVHIIDSKDSENTDWKADVTVINYDYLYKRGKSKSDVQLRYTRSLSKKWGAVILDEVHLCKNSKSLRSKAVMKIVKKANKVYALSGTVVMNRPQELINILNIIGRFDIFPDLKYFLFRYCNARMTRFGLDSTGASYTSELYEVIKHYCYFRKNKDEVLTELPEVIEQVIDSPITNTKEYKKAEDDLIAYLEEFDIEAAERAKRAEHLVRIANLKKLSLKGKLKFIIQFLKDWKEADEELKMLVFGTLTEPLEQLHKEFKKESELIIGRSSTEEKMEKIERWKESKQFLFANIATLSTGVDGLQQVCSNMIFIEYPNGPSYLEQAIARLDRIGQKSSTNVYYIMSQDTIDVRIREILDEKILITNAVNKGLENISSSESVSLDIALLKKYKETLGCR